MMNSPAHITNAPLPLDQNFRKLKQQGLNYIQEHSGSEWTNFNAGDPGITILDQVCYALTELGYCNAFPMEDILARRNGRIETQDRFYRPGEILTTTPVTVDDYRRYIVDGVEGVTNAVVSAAAGTDKACFPYRVYRTYLQLEASVASNANAQVQICLAACYYLNKSRNLGELFACPQPLQPVQYTLFVQMEISDVEKVYELLKALNNAICNYIFPVITQSNYFFAADSDINESYNGPLLRHGTISGKCLGQKKDVLHAVDITLLAEEIPGIISIVTAGFCTSLLSFQADAVAGSKELIVIDLPGSVGNGLEVWSNGVLLNVSVTKLKQVLSGTAQNTTDAYFNANTVEEPHLPRGKFRDILSYYSIQNTFPEIFAVGPDSVNANATPYRIAQSRQLKGYLTLFDQVLANQFAQLAGVGDLFSFTNTETGNRAEEKKYLLPDGEMVSPQKDYPAGYRSFSPTYFFQPLYHVPHIRPLLKGNEIFNFGPVEQEAKEQAHNSWVAYQNDPYNAYIRGLMDFTEEEAEGLERRNNILNHLLARHGESPLVIDTYAEVFAYTGNRLQGLIIIKSLYLQNLGLLSYNRQKAYNYQGANPIDATLKEIPKNVEEVMLCGNRSDFIFDSQTADREGKLHPWHFIQYAAIELKLNLLFALRVGYEQYIIENHSRAGKESAVRIAYWFIRQRRGLVLIEEALLYQSAAIAEPINAKESFGKRYPFLNNGIIVILPDFLHSNSSVFKERLSFFLGQELPAHLPYRFHFISVELLLLFIPAFCYWHNSLIYKKHHPASQATLQEHAVSLINILSSIQPVVNA